MRDLLGGYLAMFITCSDERSVNEELYVKMQEVYEKHFRVRQNYNCELNYENVTNYGYVNYCYYEWKKEGSLPQRNISHISVPIVHT